MPLIIDDMEPFNNLGLTKNLDEVIKAKQINPSLFTSSNEQNQSNLSNMQPPSLQYIHKSAHNADQLIASADHSDIKHT